MILENYVHQNLKRSITNTLVELDLYLPQEKLAFEYQGENHFYDVFIMGPNWLQKGKDEEKRKLCTRNGITLIEVPYWWDSNQETLMATIHECRPDLILQVSGMTIPNDPPTGFPKGEFLLYNN